MLQLSREPALAQSVDSILSEIRVEELGEDSKQLPPIAGASGVKATVAPVPSRESILLNALLALHENLASSTINYNLELLSIAAEYPDLAALIQRRL